MSKITFDENTGAVVKHKEPFNMGSANLRRVAYDKGENLLIVVLHNNYLVVGEPDTDMTSSLVFKAGTRKNIPFDGSIGQYAVAGAIVVSPGVFMLFHDNVISVFKYTNWISGTIYPYKKIGGLALNNLAIFPNPKPITYFNYLIPMKSHNTETELNFFLLSTSVDSVTNAGGVVVVEFPPWDPPATPALVSYSGSQSNVQITKGHVFPEGHNPWHIRNYDNFENTITVATDDWDTNDPDQLLHSNITTITYDNDLNFVADNAIFKPNKFRTGEPLDRPFLNVENQFNSVFQNHPEFMMADASSAPGAWDYEGVFFMNYYDSVAEHRATCDYFSTTANPLNNCYIYF